MSVHFFESSSNLLLKLHLSMFLSCWQISLSPPWSCLFIRILFFQTVLNGIVLLTFLYEISLLAWRSGNGFLVSMLYPVAMMNFLVSMLYPVAMMNLFTSVSTWCVASLGCCLHSTTTSPEYHECPTSFLPIWIPLIIVSCLIVVGRTSSSMLNRRDALPFFFQILVGRLSACHHWVLRLLWVGPV